MTTENNDKRESWTVLWCETVEDILDAVNDKEFIWPLIFRGIEWLMENDRKSNMILECKLVDGRETVWISISDEDVDGTLEKMLNWRLDREEYEECAVVKSLHDRWNDRRNMLASAQLDVH
jgi:hypothetical protein